MLRRLVAFRSTGVIGMRRENVLLKSDPASNQRTVDCLLRGGVVLLPTDTVYGLAVLPTCKDSIERVYGIKGRPRQANLPVMVASESDIDALGFALNEAARRLLRSPLVPGSLTLALGFRRGPAAPWLAGREEAAVRIPNEHWLLAVLRIVGPLLVTSANVHGANTPDDIADVLAQLQGTPDLAVDGCVLHTVPSTLVNCRRDPPVIERVGIVPEAVVMEYLK